MAFISLTCFHIGMISHRLKLKLGIKPMKGCFFFLNPGFVTSLWGKKWIAQLRLFDLQASFVAK